MLHLIYGDQQIPCDIIKDVTFIGGAAHFSKNDMKYEQMFNLVNGNIKNVYSKDDWILIFYIICERNLHPIGREEIKV